MTRPRKPPATRLGSDPLDWIAPTPASQPSPDLQNERNQAMT